MKFYITVNPLKQNILDIREYIQMDATKVQRQVGQVQIKF